MFTSGSQLGDYILVKKLGRGGFGEVWLAEKRTQFVNKKVAVKLPFDEQINFEAIKQEATLWEEASGHPNVLPIMDADIYDNQVVIVSEYADGGSLADKLEKEGKLSTEQSLEMTIGILKGLDFLHSRQIIHRDIKPQNVLLQGNTPRLADFGISRLMNTSKISSVVVGTDGYMSPEAFDGKRNVQTDIWSVGVLLYELLTGKLPFSQEHPSERMFAILTKDFTPIPDEIPQDIKRIIQRTLSKKPEERFQTAVEMCKKLQESLMHFQHPTFATTKVFDRPITIESPTEESLPIVENTKRESKSEIKTVAFTSGQTKESEINQTERIIPQPIEFLETQIKSASPTIPPTQVEFNRGFENNRKKQNKSLYLYIAGIIGALAVIGILGLGSVLLYFTFDSGKKDVSETGTSKGQKTISTNSNDVVVTFSNNKLVLKESDFDEDKIVDEFKKELSDKSPADKTIYISTSSETKYVKVFEVIQLGNKADIINFGLHTLDEDISNSAKIIYSGSATFNNVKNFQMSMEEPLNLTVKIEGNGQLKLNDRNEEEGSLASFLRIIFKYREDNGVFKVGTNEVEKTIIVKASLSAKYGDVLRIIKIIKKSGATPIILRMD